MNGTHSPDNSSGRTSALQCLKARISFFMSAMILVFGMGASTSASAYCGLCFDTKLAVEMGTAQVIETITMNTNSILTALEMTETKIILAIQGNTQSLVAGGEKGTAAGKELTQAQLNYDAARASTESVSKAVEMYTGPSAQAFKTCELLSQAQQVSSAEDEARINSKVAMTAYSKRNGYTPNTSVAAKEVLDDYKNNYCSQADVERGRCTTVAAVLMQGAPTRADVLLTPVANNTYTAEEAKAADAFIKMVTNPVPVETLPKGMEKMAGGDRFVLEQMNANAQMSVAQYSLLSIKNNQTAPETANGNSNAAGISGSLSVVGLMHKFVDDKFGNKDYATQLAGMNENGMLRELNVQMAFNNWVDFQGYVQSERIEALLATQLAAAARERAERQLSMARGMVGKTR